MALRLCLWLLKAYIKGSVAKSLVLMNLDFIRVVLDLSILIGNLCFAGWSNFEK